MTKDLENEDLPANTYAYSAAVNMFYILDMKESFVAVDGWPSDAVEVEDEIYNEYAAATPPEGKQRVAGPDGLPAWGDIPPPSHEQLVAQADWQKQTLINQAISVMNDNQWAGKASMGRLTEEEKATYNGWLDYLDALEAIDTSKAPDIVWPAAPAG